MCLSKDHRATLSGESRLEDTGWGEMDNGFISAMIWMCFEYVSQRFMC